MLNLQLGKVTVATSEDGSHPLDYWVDRALDKIIYVGKDLPPEIREQALLYQGRIKMVLKHYMQEAIKAHKSDMARETDRNGEKSLGEFIRTTPIR